jgi:hypothetical protein
MKLILFQDDKKVHDVIENVENPVVSGKSVRWLEGSIIDITPNFIIVDDEVDLIDLEYLTEEILSSDKSGEFHEVDEMADLKAENERLKNELLSVSSDLQGFMDFYFESLGE